MFFNSKYPDSLQSIDLAFFPRQAYCFAVERFAQRKTPVDRFRQICCIAELQLVYCRLPVVLTIADGKTLTDVGIPAGGRVLTRFDVDPLLVQQWISYGAAPANVVAVAMVRSGED